MASITTLQKVNTSAAGSQDGLGSARDLVSWANNRMLQACWAAFAILCINYMVQTLRFHHVQQRANQQTCRTPPRYPSLIPWLGHTLPFALDNRRFLDRAA
jgi:hypothetical protein